MAQHAGVELRLDSPYFRTRTLRVSQGDIYGDVPVERWPAPDDLPEITSAEAMVVLPASCLIDHKTSRLHIAPVFEIAALGAPDDALPAIRKYDCHHEIMYLPAEGEQPERVVDLRRMLSIERAILEECDQQSQCTAYATRLLMRKLVLFNTGNHFPYWTFDLRPDDFPGEDHLEDPAAAGVET